MYWHRQGIDIPAAKRHDDRITYISESFIYIFIYIWAHVCTAKNHIYQNNDETPACKFLDKK